MPQFQASVQYNDWKGSAAADNADSHDLHALLSERGLVGENEVVVGFKIYVGALLTPQEPYFSISAYLAERGDVERTPLRVRKVGIEGLSVMQFFNLFKRFEIALGHRHVNFHGFEYEGAED